MTSLRWLAVFLYVLLWSSGFIPSRVLLQEIPPLWAAVLRLFLAGGLLVGIAVMAGQSLPRQRHHQISIVLIGLSTNVVYLGLLYFALRHLSSGMAAIIASTNPLFLALLAPRLLGESLRIRKLFGTLIGFAGVVFVMAARTGSVTEQPSDVGLAILAVLGLVVSTIVFKRAHFPKGSLLAVTAVQLLVGALALLPAAIMLEPNVTLLPRSSNGWWSLFYLVTVMSVGASLLWFWLLEGGEASRVSSFYFLIPIFGLLLSHLTLGEPLGLRDAIGAVGIAIGIALVQIDVPKLWNTKPAT